MLQFLFGRWEKFKVWFLFFYFFLWFMIIEELKIKGWFRRRNLHSFWCFHAFQFCSLSLSINLNLFTVASKHVKGKDTYDSGSFYALLFVYCYIIILIIYTVFWFLNFDEKINLMCELFWCYKMSKMWISTRWFPW